MSFFEKKENSKLLYYRALDLKNQPQIYVSPNSQYLLIQMIIDFDSSLRSINHQQHVMLEIIFKRPLHYVSGNSEEQFLQPQSKQAQLRFQGALKVKIRARIRIWKHEKEQNQNALAKQLEHVTLISLLKKHLQQQNRAAYQKIKG